MKLIVGLGNPGEKYKNNRHNVGFQFVDYLIENLQISNFKFQKHLKSMVYSLKSNLVLAKPITFMNLSGTAVKQIIGNWKLEIRNLVVEHDDLDIPLGKFKNQKGTGPLLHNGIESIEKTMGTKDFWRIRIGIDNRPVDIGPERSRRVDGETYVLQNFSEGEKTTILTVVFPAILKRLQTLMSISI